MEILITIGSIIGVIATAIISGLDIALKSKGNQLKKTKEKLALAKAHIKYINKANRAVELEIKKETVANPAIDKKIKERNYF